jgi:hypothetical protein
VPIKFSSVVLPSPEGPLIITNSPLEKINIEVLIPFDVIEFGSFGERHVSECDNFFIKTFETIHFL